MKQLLAFARFELGRLLRSWKFLVITVGFPVVFYMLFLGDRRAGRVIDGTVPWRTYLLVSMCSFGSLVAALTAGGARLSIERASGWSRLAVAINGGRARGLCGCLRARTSAEIASVRKA